MPVRLSLTHGAYHDAAHGSATGADQEAERLARSQLYFISAFRSGEPVEPQLLAEEADEVDLRPATGSWWRCSCARG